MSNLSQLKKRFSIGLTLGMKEEEYLKIIQDYREYIYEIYFSPPFGRQFHTRPQTAKIYESNENVEAFWRLLAVIKKVGIKLCMALNQIGLTRKQLIESIRIVKENQEIDSIVCLRIYAKEIKKNYPYIPLTVSYNDVIDRSSKVDLIKNDIFDSIVLGRSSLRNFKLINYIKKKGFSTKHLLNNGCNFTCINCKSKGCYQPDYKFELVNELGKISIDEQYALQTLMPWEFHEFGFIQSSDIDLFKISNRPSDYNYLDTLIRSYIYNLNYNEIKSEGNYNNPLIIWTRGNLLPPYINKMNYNNIENLKQKIWLDCSMQSFGRKNG